MQQLTVPLAESSFGLLKQHIKIRDLAIAFLCQQFASSGKLVKLSTDLRLILDLLAISLGDMNDFGQVADLLRRDDQLGYAISLTDHKL